jgi:hypothetical protein
VWPPAGADRFRDRSGIRLGTGISASVQITVAGIIDAVPSVASRDAVLVDLPSLHAYQLHNGDRLDPPNEWWLAVEPGQHDRVRAQLAGMSGVTVVDRVALTRQLLADPLGSCSRLRRRLGATLLRLGLAVDARATPCAAWGPCCTPGTADHPASRAPRRSSRYRWLGVLADSCRAALRRHGAR